MGCLLMVNSFMQFVNCYSEEHVIFYNKNTGSINKVIHTVYSAIFILLDITSNTVLTTDKIHECHSILYIATKNDIHSVPATSQISFMYKLVNTVHEFKIKAFQRFFFFYHVNIFNCYDVFHQPGNILRGM